MDIENTNQLETDQFLKTGQKKGRLIIRNLVFDINPKMLTKLFKKYGKVIDI